MLKATIFHGLALTAALVLTGPASAGPISLQGDMAQSTSGLCHFTASLSYTAGDATHGALSLVITNTTDSGVGGYLTAFVLNNPGNAVTGITSVTTDFGNFQVLGGPGFQNGVNGAPYGQFDLGAGLGGSFEGGGSPNSGIGIGLTGHFEFALTGVGLDGLTTASFVNELSVPPGQGMGPQFFVARFKGLFDDIEGDVLGPQDLPDSDKVPALGTPEPSGLLLATLGVGLLGLRRRRP